jgi:hypothetical protein
MRPYETERKLVLLFEEGMKPIYPNLIKKQTRLEFEAIHRYREARKFFISCTENPNQRLKDNTSWHIG